MLELMFVNISAINQQTNKPCKNCYPEIGRRKADFRGFSKLQNNWLSASLCLTFHSLCKLLIEGKIFLVFKTCLKGTSDVFLSASPFTEWHAL